MFISGRLARSVVLVFTACAALVLALVSTPAANAAPVPGAKSQQVNSGKTAAKKAAEKRYKPAGCATLTTKQRNSKVPYAHCYALGYANSAGHLMVRADGPPSTALSPADLRDAYDLPDTGEGETVAIVDAGGYANAESDLAVFRSYYGLPPCTTDNGCFAKVDQNGGTSYPPEDPSWSIETALDLDAISSVCPKCNLLLVEGDTASIDDLGTAANTAADMGAVAISNSYGMPGGIPDEQAYDHYYDHPGIAVTASTGDTGDVTNWPAESDVVVGIGGTTLTSDDSQRGWTETAWADGGSGCSQYEPRPDYQAGITTNCPDDKAIADISTDADPATGIGVYNTSGQSGWAQWGGTSLSSPLVAAMYALAGTPVPGTYPVTYPYQNPEHANLFDVTKGSNGGCGNVLCNAGPGWDGPTGLGTPNGVKALTLGEYGDIVGKVIEKGSGDVLAGATVSAGDGYQVTTDENGHYDLAIPSGSYDLTASDFGYKSKTTSSVAVQNNQTTTANFTLAKLPTRTLSGVVRDGAGGGQAAKRRQGPGYRGGPVGRAKLDAAAQGHGWPLYAKITIDGYPNGAIHTDPYTGYYSVDLPQGNDYTLHIAAQYPGYATKDVTVHLGNSDKTRNATVAADQSICTAPGYAYKYDGTTEQFTGWQDKTSQDGWTITDNKGNGQTWSFDNPGDRTPPPGSTDEFAIVDSDHYGSGNNQDTSLVSPVIDMSNRHHPEVAFDTYYNSISGQSGDVDVSIDGGQTWSTVWHQTDTSVQGHVDVPIPQAAGKPDVRVRFHYTGSWSWWWSIDNVFLGDRTCAPVHGGLVAGVVKDNNTGDGVNGAKVTSDDKSSEFGTTMETPDDPSLSDGFYWMFSSLTGSHKFTANKGAYKPASATANVLSNFVTHQNFTLQAGHLTVQPNSISVKERLGKTKSRVVKFTDDGTEPVHVKLSEQNGGFTPMYGVKVTKKGAPLHKVKLKSKAPMGKNRVQAKPGANGKAPARQLRSGTPYAAPWTDIANYPTDIVDNAAAFQNGKAYSIGGFDGSADSKKAYVYDPASAQWKSIADAPVTTEEARAAFVNGKLYLVGGWVGNSTAATTYAYDPQADSWSQVASMPSGASAEGIAAVNGKIYAIGGCTTTNCAPASTAVYRYDPGADSWTQVADYPTPVSYVACAGISGQVVCAGGLNSTSNQSLKSTYAYNPSTDSWTKMADMPIDLWGAAVSGANNKLQVAMGATANGTALTNQAFQYDPRTDEWSALPNANNTLYRGAGSCGMYQIGGGTPSAFTTIPHPFSAVLPGYDQCGSSDVPWLRENKTEFDLPAGQSVDVRLRMDSSMVSQPGDYAAGIAIQTDTPYSVQPVSVHLHVNPPRAWGKLKGTVTDANGDPVPGATVQINTFGGSGQVGYTLKTDGNGDYQLWLDHRYNPLQVIAAKDKYIPQVKKVKIFAGETTTLNFTLKKP